MQKKAICLWVVAIVLVVVSPATADPSKLNCPNGTDWQLLSTEQVADIVWPQLVDQSPWVDKDDFLENAVRPDDKNGDNLMCLKTNDQSNPNGKWFGIPYFVPRDNNANAS